MKIKHSKYKNTGLLFELLVRQITADTLNGGSSPSLNIINFMNHCLKAKILAKAKLKSH